MSGGRSRYVCRECGHSEARWFGRCPACGAWNALEEVVAPRERASTARPAAVAVPLAEVDTESRGRMSTGFGELDRVLGGGLVPGAVVLLGGDPGIGKSTLLLQAAYHLAVGGAVLYVTGEESVEQVRLRADRLGPVPERLLVLPETRTEVVEAAVHAVRPHAVIVDSIQTLADSEVPSAPGTVVQVRASALRLVSLAKETSVPVILVGHVTKDGGIAGPKALEHVVDVVLYLEGDQAFRILRGAKNRFGSTGEVGVFQMEASGMREVLNPSGLFLAERSAGLAGSVVTVAVEGSRALLVEIQALLAPNPFGSPRRTVTGMDPQRVALLMAVLERRCRLPVSHDDVYVKVAGGLRVDEPAADLALALALASSHLDVPLDPSWVAWGEVGLGGEVRAASQPALRAREALRLGFGTCLVPPSDAREAQAEGARLTGVGSLEEAVTLALRRRAEVTARSGGPR